jgi:hypothetical protein
MGGEKGNQTQHFAAPDSKRGMRQIHRFSGQCIDSTSPPGRGEQASSPLPRIAPTYSTLPRQRNGDKSCEFLGNPDNPWKTVAVVRPHLNLCCREAFGFIDRLVCNHEVAGSIPVVSTSHEAALQFALSDLACELALSADRTGEEAWNLVLIPRALH